MRWSALAGIIRRRPVTAKDRMMQHDRANEAWVNGSLRLAFENSPDAILLLDSILHQMSDGVIVADKLVADLRPLPARSGDAFPAGRTTTRTIDSW